MMPKICLRCDWDGETNGSACPNCGVPLYVIGAPRKPKARNDPMEPSHPAEPSDEPQGERTSRTDSPESAAATFARSAGALVVAALVLMVLFDTWLTDEGTRQRSSASTRTTVEDSSADLPADAPSPSADGLGPIEGLPGGKACASRCRQELTVGGVPFSFRVPARGWEQFGDMSINKSIVGSQAAEAIIYWTTIPGDYANPCIDVFGMPFPRSVPQLANAVSTAPGTELVTGPADVTVGGRRAKHVQLVVRDDVGCDPGYFFIWHDMEAGALWPATEAGHTISAWVVDTRETPIVIGAVTTDRATAQLDEEIGMIVRSIRFDA
jgi:hypothetical protein